MKTWMHVFYECYFKQKLLDFKLNGMLVLGKHAYVFESYLKLSLYSKKKLLLPPLPPLSLKMNYEKTNSFRNTKFSTQIAILMKMCKMSSSKIKDQLGPRWGPP